MHVYVFFHFEYGVDSSLRLGGTASPPNAAVSLPFQHPFRCLKKVPRPTSELPISRSVEA